MGFIIRRRRSLRAFVTFRSLQIIYLSFTTLQRAVVLKLAMLLEQKKGPAHLVVFRNIADGL